MGLSVLDRRVAATVHPLGPAASFNITVRTGVPFVPWHVSVNVRLFAVRITFCDPAVGFDPVQAPPAVAPPAVQAVAFCVFQLRVAAWPGSTEVGVIEKVTAVKGGLVGWTYGVPDEQPERTKSNAIAEIYRMYMMPLLGNRLNCVQLRLHVRSCSAVFCQFGKSDKLQN